MTLDFPRHPGAERPAEKITAHPDAERLAEYIDNVLPAAARAEVESHLVGCSACREVVAETIAIGLADSAETAAPGSFARVIPFRSRLPVKGVAAGLAAVAALVLVIRFAPEWSGGAAGPPRDRPELRELVAALANEPMRPAEGRLTGGFKYAPPPSPTRGAGDRNVSPDVRIAAAKIEKLATQSPSVEHTAAFGLALLALGDFDRAIASLEAAVAAQPANGLFRSDLATAYLARASRFGRPDDFSRALSAAEQASIADPDRVEPYFTKALTLEGLHRDERAVLAWEEYLRRDPGSPWKAEAEQRLASLRGRPQAGANNVKGSIASRTRA